MHHKRDKIDTYLKNFGINITAITGNGTISIKTYVIHNTPIHAPNDNPASTKKTL